MDYLARHSRMTFTVLPSMARQFQEHYESNVPELSCVSCHGEDGEAVNYRMPNGLYPLDPDRLPTEGRTVAFMRDVVTPSADRLMTAGGTTTCFSCHERQGASP